jgi:hypothetical protein
MSSSPATPTITTRPLSDDPYRRRILLLLGLTGAVCLAIVTWGSLADASVRSETERYQASLGQAHLIAQRLEQLPISPAGGPQPDRVATLVRRILVTAGVGQEAFAGVQPLGDTPLPGGTWHRQQVLVQLRQLNTQQAAAVVAAVARTDPAWAVTSVQLTHGTGGDSYEAGLALTTLYPAQP